MADRKYTFGTGALIIDGKEYPVSNVEFGPRTAPIETPPPDLQELGMRIFEQMCADAGVKCTRIEVNDG